MIDNPMQFDLVCRIVNATPAIQSLLYDLSLLPEQTLHSPQEWRRTMIIALTMDELLRDKVA